MFLISGPELVIAQCNAGVIGAFPALNARSTVELQDWVGRIAAATSGARSAPYAVNLIVNARNHRLHSDLDVCISARVPIVITSMSSPEPVVAAVHAYGGAVFHDAATVRHARKAASCGVDGLILVCAGAGGHTGYLSPFAFVAEVRRFFRGRLVLAGAMATGAAILAARVMGCELAYVGTRFIATRESMAPDAYKQMIVESAAEDIVCTSLFSGVKANYLAGSIRNAGLDPANLPQHAAPSGYRRRADGPTAWRDVWGAGQGVGSISDVPTTRELVDRLIEEYQTELRTFSAQALDAQPFSDNVLTAAS